jgi:lysophospholipase L1-like esterase
MTNTAIRSLSARHDLVVADINRHYRPRRDRLGADAFHPNELGYSEWTRAIAESIGLETG